MAQFRELSLDICAFFNDTLTAEDSSTERIEKIRSFVKERSAVQDSIGDFKLGLEWFNCKEPLSLGRQLQGKIVVLDFFTYCCINCLHILPHLRELEETYTVEDGLIIIGVHSAKFDNEKDSANISAALKRYDISHPVVNDSEGELWLKLGITCWPTALILGPKGQPLFQLIGEFKKEDLFDFVSTSIDIFKASGEISSHQLPLSLTTASIKGPLLFPGKVVSTTTSDGSELIAIANTGLHCIIIAAAGNKIIKHIVGCSGQPGFIDGTFNTCRFNAPQGLAFTSQDILFVADTENHAIRKIDLKQQCVETVVGNGLQASDKVGGGSGAAQPLSSPWDLCYIRRRVPCTTSPPQPVLCICPQAPSDCRGPDGNPPLPPAKPSPPPILTAPLPPPIPKAPLPPPIPKAPLPPLIPKAPLPPPAPKVPLPPPLPCPLSVKPTLVSETPSKLFLATPDQDDFVEHEILLIAMAGSHQIWAFFLQDTMWWGKEFFMAGTCASIAGSGVEANRNNSYPRSSSFAQPSGLTYCPKSDELFVADSESSSIRCIQMKTGKVSAVVGGSKVPDDLFSFGDVDADRYNAKLQHPLGVAWHEKSQSLLVADTYNHKIKSVNLETLVCSSLIGTGHAGNTCIDLKSPLNEPGGLSVSMDQSKLYIADTNNHCIKVMNFSSNSVIELDLHHPDGQLSTRHDTLGKSERLTISFGGKIELHVNTILPSGLKLTEDAPQRWSLKLPGSNWKASDTSGLFDPRCTLKITLYVPPSELSTSNEFKVELSSKLFLCSGSTCQAANCTLVFLVVCDQSAPSEVVHCTSFENV